MPIFYLLGAVCLGAASRILKSKMEKTAAAVVVGVVGIGLLVGSISLFANPVQSGPFPGQITNVCAPVVSSVTVTDDGSAGLRVSVSISSHGWDMFRRWFHPSETGFSRSVFYGYRFFTYDAVRHYRFLRGTFYENSSDNLETWDGRDYNVPVYFDYFVRGLIAGGTRATGGQYFSMRIQPEWFGLQHVRGEHYHTLDHYVDILLYVTNFGGPNGDTLLPIGQYVMHCWVSDTDGNGYYVPVHFGDQTFRQGLD